MSIINEALRKLEQGKQEKKEKPVEKISLAKEEIGAVSPEAPLAKNPVEKLGGEPKISVQKAVIISCLVLMGFVFVLMFSGPGQKPSVKPVKLSAAGAAPVSKELPQQAEPPRPAKFMDNLSARSSFKLTGTMLGSGEPLAIINNRIVSEGDEVSGASVLEISQDTVTLSYQNQEFSLKVK